MLAWISHVENANGPGYLAIVISIALCIATAGLLLRRRGHRWLSLSRRAALCGVGLTSGAMLVGAWWFVVRETPVAVSANLSAIRPTPIRYMNTSRLEVAQGDPAPPIDARGWINGPPPDGLFAGQVLVIDIFDDH